MPGSGKARRWRALTTVLAVVVGAVMSPAVADIGGEARASTFPVDCHTAPNGVFTFLQLAPVYDIYFAFDGCGYTPEKIFIGARYQAADGRTYTRSYCVGVGLTRVGWVQSDYAAPNHVGEFISGSIGSRSDCQLTTVIVPPRPDERTVTATGVVEIERNSGGTDLRGLSGARYELRYWGRSGAGTPLAWRPVTAGPGGTGANVEGYLGDDGEYEVSFAYPNRQTLSDGSTWEGCPQPAEPVPHLDSYACEPEHIVLNVYPEDEGGVIRVFEPDRTETIPATEVHLGHYFQESDKRTKAFSFAAHAYAGVRNVLELVGGSMAPVTVKLIPGVHSSYFPRTAEIRLDTSQARSTVPEHEAAHHVEFTTGDLAEAPGCQTHTLFGPTNDQCAWQEGFADFLGVLAENELGKRSWTTFTIGNLSFDLEQCTEGASACPERFRKEADRRAVEAWVSAALWDLVDDTPLETRDWFPDLATRDVGAVLGAVASAKPTTYYEFINGLEGAGSPEIDVSFMNHQMYEVMVDDRPKSDLWLPAPCACLKSSANLYEPQNAAVRQQTQWVIKNRGLTPGQYDVWVNVPVAAWFGPMDTAARYRVEAGGTTQTARIDQSALGWHRLPVPVTVVDPDALVQITLSGGSDDPTDAKGLAADAVVLVPKG